MGPPARILIVDDHETLRRGVRALLVAISSRWEVCGEAEDGQEAVEKVQKLEPDLVILDVSLPVVSGLEVARQIRQLAPCVKIVVFSVHEAPTVKAEFHSIGADAFVVKSAPSTELIAAVSRLLPPNQKYKAKTADRN